MISTTWSRTPTVDAHAFEGASGDAFALVEQSEKDVLGADVAVVEEPRFFLGQDHDPAGSIGEALKQLLLTPTDDPLAGI